MNFAHAVALAAALGTGGGGADGPSSFRARYQPPAPGSYHLPVVQRVVNHPILDEHGERTTLFEAKGARLAVVSFMYTACSDAQGCPLATATLHRLDRALADDRSLADRVALLSVSFDPERDTPDHLAAVRATWRASTRWRFLTAASEEALEPILADFDQPVARLVDEQGEPTARLRHVLKVYLLDEENAVRNVYSAEFLDPALILGDLKTLQMPAGPTRR